MNNSNLPTSLQKLDETLELYLVKKVPSLPPGIKEFLVTIAPWLTLIGVIISIPAILVALGIGAATGVITLLSGGSLGTMLSLVLTLVIIVLEGLAIPGLFKKSRNAWNLLLYASILSVVSGVITLSVSSLISAAIGLYVLYQLKEYYK